MFNQIVPYFDSVFSKFQYGFRKSFNAQHCLITMVEKWRKTLEESCETGSALTDLAKAFDCIDHNLLIGKLNAYGFEKRSFEFIILTSLSVNKEPKLALLLVLGKCYSQVFHKGQS